MAGRARREVLPGSAWDVWAKGAGRLNKCERAEEQGLGLGNPLLYIREPLMSWRAGGDPGVFLDSELARVNLNTPLKLAKPVLKGERIFVRLSGLLKSILHVSPGKEVLLNAGSGGLTPWEAARGAGHKVLPTGGFRLLF